MNEWITSLAIKTVAETVSRERFIRLDTSGEFMSVWDERRKLKTKIQDRSRKRIGDTTMWKRRDSNLDFEQRIDT